MYWKPTIAKEHNQKAWGKVHVYTGEGKGKTTAAMGLALRAAGHNRRVLVVQFLHGKKDAGEFLAQNKLAPFVEIVQFGTPEGADVLNPSEVDIYFAQQGMEYVRKQMVNKRPDLLILDEILPAVHFGLLEAKDVVDFLRNKHANVEVVLTGRHAHPDILNEADLVTVMQNIKTYLHNEDFIGRQGLDS